MKYSIILSSAVAMVAAQVDPLTVTALNPAQSTAFAKAESSLIDDLIHRTGFDYFLVTMAVETRGLDEFTSAVGALTRDRNEPVQTGRAAVSAASSLLDILPDYIADYFQDILSEEVSVASSIVNDPSLATGKPV